MCHQVLYKVLKFLFTDTVYRFIFAKFVTVSSIPRTKQRTFVRAPVSRFHFQETTAPVSHFFDFNDDKGF